MMQINALKKICFLLLLLSLNNLKPYEPFLWVSTINDTSAVLKDMYLHLLRSFVHVIKTEKGAINAVLLYDGNDDIFMERIKSIFDVHIIHARFSLTNSKEFQNKKETWKARASGSFLRLDACDLLKAAGYNHQYALYTDVDTIFQHDPRQILEKFKPKTFGVISESTHYPHKPYNSLNSGVMWMNTKFMRQTAPSLREFICKNNFKMGDQGVLKNFYKGQWEELPDIMNWLFTWGISKDAVIIHYIGPKPNAIEKYLKWYLSDPNAEKVSRSEAAKQADISQHYIKFFRKKKVSPSSLHYVLNLYKQYDD